MLKRLSILLFLSPLTLLAGSVDVRQDTVEGMAVGTVNNNFRRLEKDKLDKRAVQRLIGEATSTSFGDTPYAQVLDEKASGTNGGTTTAGVGVTHVLNTLRDGVVPIPGLSLSSNQITFPAGTYLVKWETQFWMSDQCRSWLRNVTLDTILGYSNSGYSTSAQVTATTHLLGTTIVSFPSPTVVDLRYYVHTAKNGDGGGIASGVVGLPEIYATIDIWKLR